MHAISGQRLSPGPHCACPLWTDALSKAGMHNVVPGTASVPKWHALRTSPRLFHTLTRVIILISGTEGVRIKAICLQFGDRYLAKLKILCPGAAPDPAPWPHSCSRGAGLLIFFEYFLIRDHLAPILKNSGDRPAFFIH